MSVFFMTELDVSCQMRYKESAVRGDVAYHLTWDCSSQKGGKAMSEKLGIALKYLAITGKILTIVSDAGTKVMDLCKG